jgi:hypothetical protein
MRSGIFMNGRHYQGESGVDAGSQWKNYMTAALDDAGIGNEPFPAPDQALVNKPYSSTTTSSNPSTPSTSGSTANGAGR